MIKLVGIKKSYGTTKILDDFSCSIKENEMVAIMGKSGSGKTTILNLIGCLDKADSGEVIINKIVNPFVNKKKKIDLFRNEIGYLFQNYALIDSQSVSENLDIALEYCGKKFKEKEKLKILSLDKVGLANKINSKVYSLSGGEQQRIAIARLFLKKSKIILADEPTGSLDVENRMNVLNLLKELNKCGKTVVIVTHDKEVGSFCDRIIKIS
ncbi:MAG: ABC transporter ATP-binding protein [Sarcina sp.]